jgi:ferredoxin
MVKVIQDKCIGCGLCESICPAVFMLRNGKANVKNAKLCKGNPKCKEAANSCPVQAIVL